MFGKEKEEKQNHSRENGESFEPDTRVIGIQSKYTNCQKPNTMEKHPIKYIISSVRFVETSSELRF